MTDDAIARVHFHADQVLRTQDFVDEQAYHVGMRRRHNLAHHTWGIVTGLDLAVDPDGVAYVGPGFGIDGYGREIALAQLQPLPPGAFADKASDVLEVWIEYDRLGSDPAPRGYGGCGDESSTFYRWRETPRVTLRVPDLDYPDPRRPKGVPSGDLAFGPEHQPPDDPARTFALYLGLLHKPAREGDPPAADVAGRPYAGLVAEQLRAASGSVLVQVGERDKDDDNRFAVFLAAAGGAGWEAEPRLAVRTGGDVRINGDATITGDLTMQAGGVEFGAGAKPPEAGRAAWRIYHVHDASDGSDELRVEMASGAPGRRGHNRVTIGAFGPDRDAGGNEVQRFRRCLTVGDDCKVEIGGDLVVGGSIRTGGGIASPGLSADARDFSSAALLSGIGGASGVFTKSFTGGGDSALRALAQTLAADPDSAARVAGFVRELDEDVARRMGDALDDGS